MKKSQVDKPLKTDALKQELQSYFDEFYPCSKVSQKKTIGGQVHVRFELGAELENGSLDRVYQATERANAIFNDTFGNPDNDVLVLIYEYLDESIRHISNNYLYKQFPSKQFAYFYNQVETIHSGYFTTDENGNSQPETIDVRIIIGKLPVRYVKSKEILHGIANYEMALEPSISQSIYFFDMLKDRAFHMYDDRGCYVWSNNADKIRDIYLKRNSWIINYHRPEIDLYFK